MHYSKADIIEYIFKSLAVLLLIFIIKLATSL